MTRKFVLIIALIAIGFLYCFESAGQVYTFKLPPGVVNPCGADIWKSRGSSIYLIRSNSTTTIIGTKYPDYVRTYDKIDNNTFKFSIDNISGGRVFITPYPMGQTIRYRFYPSSSRIIQHYVINVFGGQTYVSVWYSLSIFSTQSYVSGIGTRTEGLIVFPNGGPGETSIEAVGF